MAVEPPGLDPTIAAPVAIREVTWVNLFEGLVRIDRDGQVQPLLAKSCEVSPDGLAYTFRLQGGVKFHDGTPFTSADVRFSFDRARAPNSTNAQKQIFAADRGDRDAGSRDRRHQAQGTLRQLPLPSRLGRRRDRVAPRRPRKQRKPRRHRAFQVQVLDPRRPRRARAQRRVLEPRQDAKLETLTFRFINDPQAQVAALRAGDVDAFPNIGAPELFADLRKDPRFTAVAGNTEGEVVAGMNAGKKPFDDPRVRRALMHAVDRKALVEGAYSGFGRPIGSHFSPNHPAFVDLTGVVPYDPARAKALLAEAGYGSGLSITIKSPQMAYASRSAELLAAMLAEVGVELKIVPTEFPAKWIEEVFRDKDYDMTIVAHAEPLDIDIYARDGYYFNYQNPRLKTLLAQAARTTDEKARFALYGDAQRLLAEEVPALFLFQLPKLGVWNAKLKGMWESTPIPSNDVTEVYWAD